MEYQSRKYVPQSTKYTWMRLKRQYFWTDYKILDSKKDSSSISVGYMTNKLCYG